MFNHNRGLWGYTGAAADGEPLTIQSTGMGGPSAAIVVEELCDLGLEVAIRVGTCGALDGGLALGDLVAVSEALAADGTSRALGAGERVRGRPGPDRAARRPQRPHRARSPPPTCSTSATRPGPTRGGPPARWRSRWRRRPC